MQPIPSFTFYFFCTRFDFLAIFFLSFLFCSFLFRPGMMILELLISFSVTCICVFGFQTHTQYRNGNMLKPFKWPEAHFGSFASAFNLNFGFDFSYISHRDSTKNPYKYLHCTWNVFSFYLCNAYPAYTKTKIIAQYTTFSVKTFYFDLSICVWKVNLDRLDILDKNFTLIRNKCV